MAQISPTSSEATTLFLGPFVGDITRSSVKIWLNIQEAVAADKNIYVILEPVTQGPINEAERAERERKKEPLVVEVNEPKAVRDGVIRCLKSDLGTGVVTIDKLEANTKYFYTLCQDEAHSIALNLNPALTESGEEQGSKRGLQPEERVHRSARTNQRSSDPQSWSSHG